MKELELGDTFFTNDTLWVVVDFMYHKHTGTQVVLEDAVRCNQWVVRIKLATQLAHRDWAA